MLFHHDAPLYVLGHINPDTDAIVSALAYAQFLHDNDQDATAIALGDANNETAFVLQQAGVAMPKVMNTLDPGSSIVLVDHNEDKQSIVNKHEHTILGVIDHHKFGGFVTQAPLHMRVEPLGSTASILTKIFDENSYTISPQLATLLASAIISDTLYLQSPTTTQQDRALLAKLQKIAQIADIEAYAMDMFAAKSDLGDMQAKDIVTMDYKKFNLGNATGGIGVIETTDPSYAVGRKSELLQAMHEIKEENNLDFVLLCIVDILQQNTQALILGDTEANLVEKAYQASVQDNIAQLGNRVSRKKQLVPPLAALFDA